MPSTYTTNGGIQKPGTGEQNGGWSNTANTNYDIIDTLVNGVVSIPLTTTTYTLATNNGVVSEGQNLIVTFTGTPGGQTTINISPQTAEKIYFVKNESDQIVQMSQGSGATVLIAPGRSKMVYTNGIGATASVFDFTSYLSMSTPSINGGAINGTPIGASTPSTGAFSTLSSAAATISGGTVNGTPIGASSASTGAFSSLQAYGSATLPATTISGQLGLGGANYGTSGQVMVSQGAGAPPTWGSGFPSGGIILWSGAIASIPSGWYLCTGANGTPDLRDRFVVGAGSTYAVGATGGANFVTLDGSQIPSHTHAFSATTDTTGAHTHTEQNYSSNGTGDGGGPGASCCGGAIENSGIQTLSAGSHSHTVSGTTGTTGSGGAHENRPPYYALAYIMKS